MKILVTGVAGFIGYHLAEKLLNNNFEVYGIDNINDYYDVNLKYDRLKNLGISKKLIDSGSEKIKSISKNFTFSLIDISEFESLKKLFEIEKFLIVVNLAAQAGVRYSLINPHAYVESNILGFLNIIECCKLNSIDHLIYASSSSVYGKNENFPFSVKDNVDNPISLYAASKKSNELIAHTYSHLFNLKTTGLRFFTVYGPWGRPDMALFIFTKSILKNEPIDIYNFGKMKRDFTYIDDIVEGLFRIITTENNEVYNLYNIGNNKSIDLLDFINEIELQLGKVTKRNLLPIQPGDVPETLADVSGLIKDYNYKPSTGFKQGIKNFIDWYLEYYK